MTESQREYQRVINGRYVYALEAFVAELEKPGAAFKPTSMKLSDVMSEFANLVRIDFTEARCFDPQRDCWEHRLSREFSECLDKAIAAVKKFEDGSADRKNAEHALDETYARLKEMSRHFFFYTNLQSRKRLEPKENP